MPAQSSRDSWWDYELRLLGRAVRNPYWSSKWHGFLGAPGALLVAGIAWEETRSWWGFTAAVVSVYLVMLIVILIREPSLHAQELDSQVQRLRRRVHTLVSQVRLPPEQRKRLLFVKQRAGLIEAKLNGPRLGIEGLRFDLYRVAEEGGNLAEYPAGEAAMTFVRVAEDLWDLYARGGGDGPIEEPASESEIAGAVDDLRSSLRALQTACDAVLLGDAAPASKEEGAARARR